MCEFKRACKRLLRSVDHLRERVYQGVRKYPDILACVPVPFEGGGTGWG